MKRHCLFWPMLALCAAISLVTSPAPGAPGDEHHDVVLDPAEGRIASDTVFTVSFTSPMVSASAINAGDATPALVAQPKFEAQYLWKSVTEGEWTIKGPLLPGTHYRITTAPGLKDQQGRVVPPQKWEFDTDAFEITSNDEQQQGGDLSDRPHFLLEANYPVSLLDAADYVYFQDRDSHERLPAEVLIESDDTAVEGTKFTVTPRQPLPMGRTFDVVVNGLCEAHSHAQLAYLHVFAAGETSPIEVKWVGGFNDALSTPRVRIKFSEDVDPDTVKADALQLTPPVANLKAHAEADEVLVEGDFDIKQHYSIVIPKTIKGDRGFGLAAPSKWGVTFHPKDPSIIFPNGEVFQRSASGFKFSLLQVNTGPLAWTLSEVPLSQLAAVSARVREYKKGETPLNLKVVGRGKFDGNADAEEVLREIDWRPPQPLSGAYLFEASATDHDGDKQANRMLVCFSEYILTLKRSHDQAIVRLARMSDGLGAPNLTIRAVTGDNVELAHAVTDASGLAVFSTNIVFPEKAPAELFIADTPTGPAIQYASGPTLAFADYERHEEVSTLRGMLVTDRNLYRPGQTLKIHGIVRVEKKGVLSVAALAEIQWKIKNDAGDPVTDGTAPVSKHGAWDAEWNIPTGLATGVYRLACESPGLESPDGSDLEFRVEEYRTPLFSVVLEEAREAAPASQLKVSSTYFHGAPNAKAKVHWKAVWANQLYQDDHDFVRSDAYSENALENDEEKTVEGDAALDANGATVLRCDPPFADGKKRGRCSVEWTIDVTSAEAQTLTAGLTATVQAAPAWAGIRASAKSGVERTISVESQAIDLDDKPVKDTPIRCDIFYVSTKTVKEKIAPFLVRYRNSSTFEKVATRNAVTPIKLDIPVDKPGEYVAVVTGPGDVPASTSVTVSGEEQAELPVQNDTDIAVTLPEPVRPYAPGETVPLSVQAPFGGVAWVSVEAGEILDTFIVPLKGNAGRIDLPIKKEYAPNATVIVYLVQPGGASALPRERIGEVRLEIARPDRELTVTPKFDAPSVRPGAPVRGQITVTNENHPVVGAEFLVFAVDDAVLQLGDWKMPDAKAVFYPERGHGVSTFAALSRYLEKIDRRSIQQKGYVIGDGGEGSAGNVSAVRKEFKTLAYWESKLTTDAQGRIPFEFTAPDNLTSYRLVAIGATDENQFGGGSSTVAISKPLLCEPALPRFVRVGDEVKLRAVARQKVAKNAHITVRCITEGLDLLDDKPVTEDAPQDIPAVFNFLARVRDESSAIKVRFEASSDIGENDLVEMSLPVRPPTVLRKETVPATIRTSSFSVADIAPKTWNGGRGSFDVVLSTSPWLPKLTGLPAILEYPHGCFEQISSRVLAYATMTDLLASLPDEEQRDAHYHAMLASSMRLYGDSMLENGLLPYWPGDKAPNYFVTVLASWAIEEAEKTGVEIPDNLSDSLKQGVQKIIADSDVHASPVIRALALMVAADPASAADNANVAQDLYLKRDRLSDEGRAMLAIALHRLGIMAKEKAQLLKEIAKPVAERAFDPEAFSSTTRAEAIITLAFAEIAPNGPQLKQRHDRLLTLLDNSANLSTEENLWLLTAFRAIHNAQKFPPLAPAGLKPSPAVTAKNGTGAAWPNNDLAALTKFKLDDLPTTTPLTCLVSAEYRTQNPDTDRTDRGLRVERVVRDLADPKRTGEAGAPFKLGDQLLVTYRVFSRNLNNYVALEDLLPAGLETVNPDLPLVAKTYQLPADPSTHQLELSHSDLRDDETCLYFDLMSPGPGAYSVLARATTAGTFHWPATKIAPMYDSRFTGLSASSSCVVSE